MSLLAILGLAGHAPYVRPAFIREIQDIRGVRVVRLQGPVGKGIGQQEESAEHAAEGTRGVFSKSVLFDFGGTTGWDFSTVSYLVQALGRRMAAHARVGMINLSPRLLAELEIARVDRWFQVFASEEEAIAELSRTDSPS